MEKLRILIVAQGYMTNTLGVLKVHYDLKEAYEEQGHLVDVLDFSVVYPSGFTTFNKIFGKLYTYRFWKYLKNHAYKYDVIDANYECIPYPKKSFGFKGVLLVRSHGIKPIYYKAEKIESYKKALTAERTNIKFKTRIGNIYRSLQKDTGLKELFASVKYADLVHCLNSEEYDYYLNYGISKEKLLLIGNGLPDKFIQTFNTEKVIDKTNALSFIGSWTIRKGIKDFDQILTNIRLRVEIKAFYLLGGCYPEGHVKKDFDVSNHDVLKIVPNFEPEDLPNYIRTCKVGLFPSFVEGFGLAVVEQLACGIPVVAYKVPGPTDILISLDETLLIEPGNHVAFAKKVIEILQLDEIKYNELSERCKQESRKYLLSTISKRFLEAYTTFLNNKSVAIINQVS
jgi:glycosyltransferase involved in cell wall biosynthesis